MKIYRFYTTGWYEDDDEYREEYFTKEALDRKLAEETKDFVDMINKRIEGIKEGYASREQERLALIHEAESVVAESKATADESKRRALKRKHRSLLHQADGIKREYDNELFNVYAKYGKTPEEMKEKWLRLCGYVIEECELNE